MSKKAWVIMKASTCPHLSNIPSVHMVGFKSKKEATIQCNLLNERSARLSYYLEPAKVFTPWEP